ncbi:putative leucine-rich repeat-containing protein DDB_G0290503 isoform X3 [Cynara cardunculus var. scolymus]|uniref:putative leucine-rich repeat-containing protein DDB_G0290503 isoform X3 n=1 Tax=Cynara cardunculus var. scolymus TaxID=59895 RepID=UPI000D62BC8E|nr:putative leucine-rich repeat-containing protein DDB_G0290503 isoform X3 [Cynara cardunculus var. scolymus]
MEHEKKKRQKKKKNKQGKVNESVSAGVGELTSENNNHVNATKPNHQNLNFENTDVQNKGLQQRVVDSDEQPINGAETASLEQKIEELHEQLNMHLQREAGYEGKLNQLVEEASTLRSTEKSAAETIASLNKDNARLQAQVIELEASRNDISHQNRQLKEHVFHLQSKIQDLESSVAAHLSSERTMHVTENEDMKSQLESAQALVEKLVSENEKLVEKVNNLNAKLDLKTETTQSYLPIKPEEDLIVRNSKAAASGIDESGTDPMPSSSAENLDDMGGSESDEVMESEVIRLKSKNVDSNLNPISSGEIVQIPLDEKDPTSTAASEVGLTEAPLIGAPFRLISFVARYVSGADLVQKNQEI